MQSLKQFTDSKHFKIILPAAIVLALGGIYCLKSHSKQSKTRVPDILEDIQQNRYLTQSVAELRHAQVSSIEYKVDLVLKKGTSYQGQVTCDCHIQHANHDLFLEFRGEAITKLIINGIQTNINWNGLFLRIDKAILKVNEKNSIMIAYNNKYSSDGVGLHSFTDADGKQYLFSQCESYFCNRVFPCMDQPDLKAKLKLSVIAPTDWVVISNEYDQGNRAQPTLPEQFNISNPSEYVTWVFNQTKLLPTYLFSVSAGPYAQVKDDNPYNNIGQTIYCRESMKEHMLKLKDFIFEVTKKSVKFYSEFFGVPYQFSKYDSVFVAEFNWGAMENPGCVVYSDVYLFRTWKPATSYLYLATLITHEMSHHWFGNYVTMKWWNDLWLNESFAEFISHYCLENIQIDSAKLSCVTTMFNMQKDNGYAADQMVTTHPIAGSVPNTEAAENIFDAITYNKGASVMHQLMFVMGAQAFGEACGNYFKRFAWRNAKFDDLIEALMEKFDVDCFALSYWKYIWIETAGLNELLSQWNPNSNTTQETLQIYQGFTLQDHPTLRRHKVLIAFFKADGTVDTQQEIIFETQINKVTYDGSKQYKAILLNYGDHSFVKTVLDEQSQHFFSNNLHLVQDVLTRRQIHYALFDSVKDGKLDSESYIHMILNNCLPHENADEILTTQYGYLLQAIDQMTPRKFKKILSYQVFNFIVNAISKLANSDRNDEINNRINLLRSKLMQFTHDDQSIQKLVNWWKQTDEDLKNVEINNECRWIIVNLVYASKKYDDQVSLREELLKEQINNDNSDIAQLVIKRCAVYTNTQHRQAIWDSFCDPNNKESTKQIAEQMSAFNSWRRFDDVVEYHDKFFDALNLIFETRTTDFAKVFYYNLFPMTDDLVSQSLKIKSILQKTPSSQVTLITNLNKSLDSIGKQVKQFECFCNNAKLAQHPSHD